MKPSKLKTTLSIEDSLKLFTELIELKGILKNMTFDEAKKYFKSSARYESSDDKRELKTFWAEYKSLTIEICEIGGGKYPLCISDALEIKTSSGETSNLWLNGIVEDDFTEFIG